MDLIVQIGVGFVVMCFFVGLGVKVAKHAGALAGAAIGLFIMLAIFGMSCDACVHVMSR